MTNGKDVFDMFSSGKDRILQTGADKFREQKLAFKKRLDRYKLIFDKTSNRSIDDFFFTLEDLPIFGKEYWFLLFIEPGGRQLMCTFGRGRSDVEIDGVKISPSDNKVALGIWSYEKEIFEFPHQLADIKMSPGKLHCRADGSKIDFCGTYPDYTLSITDLCDIKLSAPKDRLPYEICEFVKGLVAYVNLYFDFEGKLNGKDWKGRCYVQKVLLTSPFSPWRWGMMHFEDGSEFSYFSAMISTLGKSFAYHKSSRFYHAPTNKTYNIGGFELDKIDNHKTRWVFNSSEGAKCFATLLTKGVHRFSMKSLGNFTYLQYPTELTDFFFQSKDFSTDLKSLGRASGITEDAFGLMF